MKIAIYSHSIAPSIDGVCRRFTSILHEMVNQGNEVLLFTIESEPEDLPTVIKYVVLDHTIFPSYPDKKVGQPTFRNILRIYNALMEFKPQVLHIVADGLSNTFSLCGIFTGIPVVGSFHTDLIDLLNSHQAYGFQKLVIIGKEALDSAAFDSCATTSHSFATKLKKQGVFCEHVIITAVDLQTFCPDKRNEKLRKELMFGDENGFLCLYVGRISNEKRLDVMVKAIQQLSKTLTNGTSTHRNAYFAIVGDGPTAKQYSSLHGQENRIYCKPRFLSHGEVAEIYASSDVHVSASQFETLGNTVLEAFACGIPVVVPKTQGYSDTVQHGVDGYLFTPGDVADARRYLQLLINDSQLCQEMGRNGLKAMKNRTISNVVLDLLEWYAKGAKNQIKRGILPKIFWVMVFSLIVPFAIVLLASYDVTVKLLSYAMKDKSSNNSTSKKD